MPATEEQYIWFRYLAQQAYDCRRCPRMEANSAVLGPLNGRIDARVLIIGEAPGRFGSATTRIPFHGDRSGENFEQLLPETGLSRERVFITNAVLCNPKDQLGRNDAPRRAEVGRADAPPSATSRFARSIRHVIPTPAHCAGGLNESAISSTPKRCRTDREADHVERVGLILQAALLVKSSRT